MRFFKILTLLLVVLSLMTTNFAPLAKASSFTEGQQKRFDDFLKENKKTLDKILAALKELEGLNKRLAALIKKIESNPAFQQRHVKIISRILNNAHNGLTNWTNEQNDEIFSLEVLGGMNKDVVRKDVVFTKPTRSSGFVERYGIKTTEDLKQFLDKESLSIYNLKSRAGNMDTRYGALNGEDGSLITPTPEEFAVIVEATKKLGIDELKKIVNALEEGDLRDSELATILFLLKVDPDLYDQFLDFLRRLHELMDKLWNLGDEKWKQINHAYAEFFPPKRTGSAKAFLKDKVAYSRLRDDLQILTDKIYSDYGVRLRFSISSSGENNKIMISPKLPVKVSKSNISIPPQMNRLDSNPSKIPLSAPNYGTPKVY